MQIAVQYTLEDYREAVMGDFAERQKALKKNFGVKTFGMILGATIGVGLVLGIEGLLFAESKWENRLTGFALGWVTVAVIGYAALILYARLRRKSRIPKLWAGQPNLHIPRTIEITTQAGERRAASHFVCKMTPSSITMLACRRLNA